VTFDAPLSFARALLFPIRRVAGKVRVIVIIHPRVILRLLVLCHFDKSPVTCGWSAWQGF